MSITPEQREARRKYIGSSDSASIMGACPWSDAYDVYVSKVLGEGKKQTDSMREGDFLEPACVAWAQWKLNASFKLAVMQVHDGGIFAANFDGIDEDRKIIVEAKWCASQDRFPDDQRWGRAGSSQIPHRTMIQVQHQLFVAGPEYTTAYVAVMRGWDGLGFGLFKVKRDDDLIAQIVAAGEKFWLEHVVAKIPPIRTKAVAITEDELAF